MKKRLSWVRLKHRRFLVLLTASLILLLPPGCEKNEITNVYINPSPKTLVFLSDFSAYSDMAISIMGSLRKTYPGIQIEYIQTSPFDVKEAAFQLELAVRNYPDSVYFTGLIEPGVNNERIVFEVPSGKRFLVPDNGLASRVFRYFDTLNCHRVENPLDYTGQNPSDLSLTDFYLQATLALISGKPLSEFGSAIPDPVTYSIQDARKVNDTIVGEIVFTDNFGNCITNITDSLFQDFKLASLLRVNAGKTSFFATFGSDYSSVPAGQNVILLDRSDRIELATCFGDISQRYTLSAGLPVKLYRSTVRIGILQYNDISEAMVSAMKDRMQSQGFDAAVNVVFIEKNANGMQSVLKDLVAELVQARADIIIPFSTPAAQAVILTAPDSIPVVFTIVTDPESSGILGQRSHVTGLSNATDFNAVAAFLQRILPDIATVGSIFNPNEANSSGAQQELANIFPFYGIEFSHATISAANEIPAAYQQVMAHDPEAILITNDNTMTLATSDLVGLALQDTIPVIGTDYANAEKGALASISVDYDLIARQTGDVAISVIRGVDPDDLPVMYFETGIIAINLQTAAVLEYIFDPDILQEAVYIFP
ncbi:MAG: SAM-dependent chlorinase/fluorinase [Lentimicrobiaceae bacterium]|nr:SAM-dependent chlorinase/fluorinase [Lentimicrobiaceae bacterium]